MGACADIEELAVREVCAQAGLSDGELKKAIEDAEAALVDADLGGGVFKQRIARPGGGKSGGFRMIILMRAGERAFFATALPRATRAISGTTSWRRSSWSRRNCWLAMTRRSPPL